MPMPAAARPRRGAASISAGPRSRPRSSTVDGEVVGDARRPTPTSGGPEDVADEMAEALLAEAAERPGSQTDVAGRDRGRLAGRRRRGHRRGRPARATCPGGSGSFPLAARLSECARGRGPGRQRRRRGDQRASSSSAPGKPYRVAARRLLGHRRRRRADPRRASAGSGRGAAGEIGHMVVKRGRRAAVPAGGAAAWRPTRAARRWRQRRGARSRRRREDRSVQDHGRKRGHDRLTSSIWERALRARRRAGRGADRRRGQGARRPGSPRRSTCSTSRR